MRKALCADHIFENEDGSPGPGRTGSVYWEYRFTREELEEFARKAFEAGFEITTAQLNADYIDEREKEYLYSEYVRPDLAEWLKKEIGE